MATSLTQVAFASLMLLTLALPAQLLAVDFPPPDKLPEQKETPDPLKMFDGRAVTKADQWRNERVPELKNLFQHYMYGQFKPAPRIKAEVTRQDAKCLSGQATLKEIALTVGPDDCPKIHMLLIVPNQHKADVRPAVVLGLNFGGNHTVMDDSGIALPTAWMPAGKGKDSKLVIDNHATDAGRGTQAERWQVKHVIDRGYALATFYYGDVAPDKPDFSDGVDRFFRPDHQASELASRADDEWGAIAIWAWGLQRAVDYLVESPDVDPERIIVFGHSRNGKAAMLAGAFDSRVAMVIPHQAGCGGTSPSRRTNPKGEPVERINKTFPHWFDGNFKKFVGHEDRLPFDQNCLIALCAPRPVLLTTGDEDQWSDPPGQFEMLKEAISVYRLLGHEGMDEGAVPVQDKIVGRELAFFIRHSPHTVDKVYWDVFLDHADHLLKPKKKP